MPLVFGARRRAAGALALTLLALLTAQAVGQSAGSATPAVGAYTLASTISPPPLTGAACASDAACVSAPAPSGGDDYATLNQAVTTAAARTVPAVIDSSGAVVIPPGTATVLLGAGTYTLTRGLRLPPNVNLRGAGITATTLLMDPTLNWQNFSYSFLIRHNDVLQAGSTNLISDLTVNGNCRTGAGAPTPTDLPGAPGQDCGFRAALGASTNTGGGVGVGDRWTVRQVRFTNLEYFKLWVHSSKDVHIIDNRFDNWGGAESGDEDNIGGGGRNEGTVIEHNQFDATIRGNSFDFTNAIGTVVRDNVVHTTPAVAAARGVQEYGNMYLEGVVGATMADNLLYGAHITLTSNAMYAHSGENKDITNPRDTVVSGNRIVDSRYAGIIVVYDDYKDANGTWGTLGGWNTASTDPADHILRPGGANVIRDNVIERPRESGIVVIGTVAHAKDTADTITGNHILNAGFQGSTAYDTGAGRIDTSGIGISIGNGDRIFGNTVVDDQAVPTTWYGIHLGARKAPVSPVNTVLTDPAGLAAANTVTGVIGYLYRYAASAPEGPPGLAVAAPATVRWNESYALAGIPIGGYRVYRNGVAVADLPVGSAAIPGNLLSAADASVETDITGWTAAWNVSVGHHTGAGAVGGASLALTSGTGGQVGLYGRNVAVVPGTAYTAVGSFQAGTTGRRVRMGLAFTAANGQVSHLLTGNSATVDASTDWMTSSFTAQAPANAVSVRVFMTVEGTAAGEVHLVDRLGLVTGTATQQWIDPTPAGAFMYQVVAYRAGTGELSDVKTVYVP